MPSVRIPTPLRKLTAEKDEVLNLSIFRPFFNLPRAIVYNSFEERQMIWDATDNRAVRGDVVGVGTEVPDRMDAAFFRHKHGVEDHYALFIGRVDPNKGCEQL